MRYMKQLDKFTCGPIAIMNAIKWAGYSIDRKGYRKHFIKRCNCTFPRGTSCTNLHNALLRTSELQISNFFNKATLKLLDEELFKNRCLIIRYFYGKFGIVGHYVLCVKKTKKHYLLINDSEEEILTKVTRKAMSKMLKGVRCSPLRSEKVLVWSLEATT